MENQGTAKVKDQWKEQFGFKAQLGVECLNLDRTLTNDIKTEEDLERLLNT